MHDDPPDSNRFDQTKADSVENSNLYAVRSSDFLSFIRDAPPGFRFWCGPTIEAADVKTAIMELERAYKEKAMGM
jgi:phosphoserine aminotransferase